jgi:hypothetical protein
VDGRGRLRLTVGGLIALTTAWPIGSTASGWWIGCSGGSWVGCSGGSWVGCSGGSWVGSSGGNGAE